MGPMAPAIGMPMTPGSETARPSGRGRNRGKRAPKKVILSKGLLGLAVEYMPYEHLGEKLGALQLQTLSGSVFGYEPGDGRVLYVLLWMLPEDGGPIADDAGGKKKEAGTGVTAELDKTFEQFRQICKVGMKNRMARFAAVNLDPLENKRALMEEALVNAWPWASCMGKEGINQANWPLQEQVSPVMVLAGVDGRIRYMGPTGGFLPGMLHKAEAGGGMSGAGEVTSARAMATR